MAKSTIPRVQELDQPEPLKDVLAKEAPDDCLPCRIMGATAFMGLGAYTYISGHSQLKAQQAKILQGKTRFGMKSRQAGITSIALALAGMGFWRMVN